MKSYKELLIEKTRVRAADAGRYNMLTMILDGASKIAKTQMSPEVTEAHLKEATRSQINQTTSARDMMKAKGAETPKLDAEIAALQEFLGPQMAEEDLKELISIYVGYIPEADRLKKNTKAVIASMQFVPGISEADPKLVNRLIVGMLK